MRAKKILIILIFFTVFSSLFAEPAFSVVIDPKHGGKDTGACGKYTENGKEKSIFEKDIVLNISKKLYTLLKREYPNMNVLLTRNDDTYLTFEERRNNIRTDKNSLKVIFISIGNNTSVDKSKEGFQILRCLPDKKNKIIAGFISRNLDKTIGGKMKNLGISESISSKNQADIIIELGFLSSPEDVLLLSDEAFLSLSAQGIFNGIKEIISTEDVFN